jgi:hypothetical protein
MGNGKSAVITVYGHNRTIDTIAVSSFDEPHQNGGGSNAETYCDTINGLVLEGNAWVFAKAVSENTQYALDMFMPLHFGVILSLDDRAVQRVMRELDSQELAVALKGEDEAIQQKIFRNMSKRAAQMLQEDMEFIGPVRKGDVRKNQEKIVAVIRHLEQTGEIVISYSAGEIVE